MQLESRVACASAIMVKYSSLFTVVNLASTLYTGMVAMIFVL